MKRLKNTPARKLLEEAEKDRKREIYVLDNNST